MLARPKFRVTQAIIEDAVGEIERLGLYVDAREPDIPFPDPKDRVFYEVVMEERNEEETYPITGNIKHFPEKPYIVTPRQMMDIILRQIEE